MVMQQDKLQRDAMHAEAFRDIEEKVINLGTMVDILVSEREEHAINKEDRIDLLITVFNEMWNDFAQEYRATLNGEQTVERE